jgi:hypothetical protein
VRQPRTKKPKEPSRLEQLASVAGQFKGWQPGREVLTAVRSVPTIFPQFDIATRVRGYPIQRVVLAHGPSNHGKTVFMMGLGKSFLQHGHFYFHVDAEFTTPEPWVQENLGALADHPGFMGLRPESYEETAECVRDAANRLRMLRDKKQIPEDTSALFGIDSLQKLVPKDFFAKLNKASKEDKNIDPLKGRGGMFMAALNTAWMRELIPMLYHCNAGILLIARESQNVDGGMFEKDYKVNGGNAVYYDSSLVCRITRDGYVERGSDDNKEVIGERHRIQIAKTKVGHKDAKVTNCYFHTSNGKLIPAGFDTARDVVELALHAGVLTKAKGQLEDSANDEAMGTVNEAVERLSDPNAHLALEELRERALAAAQPEETEELAC